MNTLTFSGIGLRTLLAIGTMCYAPFACGKYSGGNGTEQSPYLISRSDDLQALGATPADWSCWFLMTDDIDMSACNSSNYNIIGSCPAGCYQPFSGVFDGDGHTIKNFNYVARGYDKWVGLFGLVTNHVINVNMVNANVNCACPEGGILAGEIFDGVIAGCHVSGRIQCGGGEFGGLLGVGHGSLYDCSADVNLQIDEKTYIYDVGGLVGAMSGDISNCRSSGLISANARGIQSCGLGGLVGRCDRDSWGRNAIISDSYSNAVCVSFNPHYGDPGYVQDTTSCLGGLLGHGAATITRCYAAGSVSGTMPNQGGLVGLLAGTSVIDSFWDINATGQNSSSGGGTGLSTAEMQTESTFLDAGWDFVGETRNGTEDIWDIAPSHGYPVFADDSIELFCHEVRYYSVPGRKADDYFVRYISVPELPYITDHGTTVAIVRLKLGGANAISQTFSLFSDAKNTVTQSGYGILDIPDTVTTDSNGEASFNVRCAGLYEIEGFWQKALEVIDITVTGGPGNNLTTKIELPVVWGYESLIDGYEQDIPLGRVITNFNQLNIIEQGLVSTGLYAGAVNNARSKNDSAYNVFTCGGYQTQVLYWFDTIRLSDEYQWVLNGFDYGPVKQLGGAHQAASLWPSDKSPYDKDYACILDPWPSQNPKNSVFSWYSWLSTIGFAMPVVGIVLEVCTAPGSSDDFINSHYPNTGNAYPAAPYWSFTSDPPPQLGVLVDCPVDAMLTDGQGRRVGYLSDTPEGQNPFISEIPGVRQYPILLPDGTRAWYFELPDSITTLELTGYGTGPVALYWMKGGQTTAFSSRMQPGRSATMTLDASADMPPMLLFSDGITVLPDGMLSLDNPWHYDPLLLTSTTTLTIHNNSSMILYPPIRIVLVNATNGISMVSPDGHSSDGFEYHNLSLPPGVLQIEPNATVSCDVRFINPQRQWFDIKLQLEAQIQGGTTAKTSLAVTHTGISGVCGDVQHPYPYYDLNQDCYVNLVDFAIAAEWWLANNCEANPLCTKLDRNSSGSFDAEDLRLLADAWLSCSDPATPCFYHP
jgi:hypothetical protein